MIAGIVLGAGQGERIGQPKAWLQTALEGECFFGRACSVLAVAGAHPVVGVIAPGWEARARGTAPTALLATNPDPQQGQLSSLQVGLRAIATDSACDAVVVLPVDVPLVTVTTVRSLLAAWRDSRAPVVRPVSADGRHGHPVVFARALFADLLRADPALGAKPLVRAHVSVAGHVPVADEGAFFDIDTAEDYTRAFGRLPQPVDLR